MKDNKQIIFLLMIDGRKEFATKKGEIVNELCIEQRFPSNGWILMIKKVVEFSL
jgi:hypothetical protein